MSRDLTRAELEAHLDRRQPIMFGALAAVLVLNIALQALSAAKLAVVFWPVAAVWAIAVCVFAWALASCVLTWRKIRRFMAGVR